MAETSPIIKPLPQPYLNDHTPYVYYLFAPFYALLPDGRTLLWLQAAFMGSGTFGVYLFAQRWLGSRVLGVLAAWLYVLNPNIQSCCLHDLHANILAVEARVIPRCAMRVTRTTDGGRLMPYQPANPCGCYFESHATGSARCKTMPSTRPMPCERVPLF
jgi:hypothetical protein